MEDPKAEITSIIHVLTQAPPEKQKEAVEKYFLPNASFQHPFCKTSSWNTLFGHRYNSRWATLQIYQWYKILSPRIDLRVLSVALDDDELVLYVTIRQQFRIWLVYLYEADVLFTTVLKLVQGDESGPDSAVQETRGEKVGGTADGNGYMLPVHKRRERKRLGGPDSGVRYYISAQNDLYQTGEWIKFLVPWGVGSTLLTLWQLSVTVMCIAAAHIFFPQTWWKQYSLGDGPPKKI